MQTAFKFHKKSKAIEEDEDFIWCIIANVVDLHYLGEEKQIRKGTKHFRPESKVYCIPGFGGLGHERIKVLGKPRNQNRLINVVIQFSLLKNYRLAKTYSPNIIEKLTSSPFYLTLKQDAGTKQYLQEIVDSFNNESTVQVNQLESPQGK